ncbi:N-acetyltransferase [Aquisalimonas asiatica]|uniref:N-acetyltransferase domain-containing protein n=1 Tax=Aquisalimonas asiatica TaxID=406100 RepID=A0A1H8QVQ9_9GAMM|nr:N-acetyltransferase [Aquisalimonas asiatica]SEO57893.1 hypothetical protein SAMN04488052_101800 [Aquisalimonas asiatica]
MRFLLDTNILIPLEDSMLPLEPSYARFVQLAHRHGHQLMYHPASERDIRRDGNETRRRKTLERLTKYDCLKTSIVCPWNDVGTKPNDACDNEILYALHCDAADYLVTEDKGIHEKARQRGLSSRVLAIQLAEDLLLRLHEQATITLPHIDQVPLHDLTPLLNGDFFDSLREGYDGFEDWFRRKAREQRQAWVYWEEPQQELGALCVFDQQRDEVITDDGQVAQGDALKLCTFKVGETSRGKKVGELFLKMAFRYATANQLQTIFIHADPSRHNYLVSLLEDFGFLHVGAYKGDAVYAKAHPVEVPADPAALELGPLEFHRRYYPHFRSDRTVAKYIVPIRPEFHRVLFPDWNPRRMLQGSLFSGFLPENSAGNAIKLAYLCHAPTKRVTEGDIVLFYRSHDDRALTSIGVVEEYHTLNDVNAIARAVSRRTVYDMKDIAEMAKKETRVMLFRLVGHFDDPVPHNWLQDNDIVKGSIQSIQGLDNAEFQKVMAHVGM